MKRSRLLVGMVTITAALGCSSCVQSCVNPDGSATAPSSVAQRLLLRDLEGELEANREIETKLADLVLAIRHSQEKQTDFLALLGERLEQSDVLISSLRSIDHAIDMTIENLSNAQTCGYKRIGAVFDGERIAHVHRIFTQGHLHQTNAPLDLAIFGQEFLQVVVPDGSIAYTRHGHLVRNSKGEIVTVCGHELSGMPVLPDDSSTLKVFDDGTISIVRPDGTISKQARMQLAVFASPEGLRPMDNTLFEPTEESGLPVIVNPGTHGAGTIRQGFLEHSNVDMTEELHALHTLATWKNSIERAILAIDGCGD